MQKEVAKIIGVTESTIWNWENGWNIQKKYLKRVGEFLGEYNVTTKLNLRPTD